MKLNLEKVCATVIAGGVLVATGYVWGYLDSNFSAVRRFGLEGLPNCSSGILPNALPEIRFPEDASEREIGFDAEGGRVSYLWDGIKYGVDYGPDCQMLRLSTSPTLAK